MTTQAAHLPKSDQEPRPLEQSQEHALHEQTCLSEDVVLAFQRGETTRAERHHIHAHVDTCERCRGLVLLAARLGETGVVDTQDSSQRLAAFIDDGFPWMRFGAGKRLAQRFEILRFVRRGGMGEVYEAFDSVVGSRVALKTLLSTAGDSERALDGLCQEVNLARRVAHAHVCRIYDLHEHREGSRAMRFLAMEFIEGETLKDRVTAAPLALSEACAIGCQLLQGLGAIHAAGVLHLDFKSQNVMLRSGIEPARAVVMDFSLSRAFEKELLLKTSERHLAGSIGYMSPEQLECQATLGPSSDVYAFGVVLFEMLTGHLPFEGESPASIMLKQLKSHPPPPSSLRPAISAALDSFVLTCLSRQPRGRFQSVDAALNELRHCLGRASARPRSASRRRHVVLVTALASLCGVLAAATRSAQPSRTIGRTALQTGAAPLAAPALLEPALEARRTEQVPPRQEAPSGRASPVPSERGALDSRAAQPLRRRAAPSGRREAAGEGAEAARAPLPAARSSTALSGPLPGSLSPPARPGAAPPSGLVLEEPPPQRPALEPRPAWTPEHAPDFLL
ncbi:MAG: serine/threonine-protein kinase [Deltaproteobacteria bacterium]